jgi:DNA-binding beta-propeller fold protein YncE
LRVARTPPALYGQAVMGSYRGLLVLLTIAVASPVSAGWAAEQPATQASLPLAGVRYAGAVDAHPVRFPSELIPMELRVSRHRRVLRFAKLKLDASCTDRLYAWWTYALRPVATRHGHFSTKQRFSLVHGGKTWRAAIGIDGAFSSKPVPGAQGKLSAAIRVPRRGNRRAMTCRTGRKHFDLAAAAGARTKVGALRQLSGAAGCLTPKGGAGCARVRGVTKHVDAKSIVVTPGGRYVYVAVDSGVLAFSRDPSTGALAQLPGPSGCFSAAAIAGCARSSRMRHPLRLVLSPDGTTLYVTWVDRDSTALPPRAGLSVLRRDASGNGTLTELEGASGCVDDAGIEGCTKWGHPEGGLTIAPDGAHLYVGVEVVRPDVIAQGVATLKVLAPSGGVSPTSPLVCVADPVDGTVPAGCADPIVGWGTEHMTFAPGGRHLYASAQAFVRDPATGALTAISGRGGCYRFDEDDLTPGLECMLLRAFGAGGRGGAFLPIAVSADGRNVYMADGDRVAGAFERNSQTGTLRQLRGRAGCVRLDGGKGCGYARALYGPDLLRVSPDGRSVYASNFLADSLVVFRRNRSTGVLRQLAGPSGCVAGPGGLLAHSCAPMRAYSIRDFAMSPDGRNLYTAADASIGVFTRRTR